MTKFKNFLLGELGEDLDVELVNRLNMKLFFVVQSLDQNKENKKNKSSSSHFNTSVSEAKVEYSINDLILATDKELAGKIFSMDKTLSGQNIDEMVGKDFNFKN